MVDKLTLLLERVAQWTLTYWLHSTLLLGLAALGFVLIQRLAVRRCRRLCESHALWERIWKFAATAGVITASLQMTFGTGIHMGASRPFSRHNDPVAPGSSARLTGASAAESDAVADPEVDGLTQLQRVLGQLETLETSFPVERQPAVDSLSDSASTIGGERKTSEPLSSASVLSAQPRSPVVSDALVDIDKAKLTSDSDATISPLPTGLAQADLPSGDGILSPHCLIGWLVIAWLSGSLVLLWIQSLRFRRLLRDSQPAAWPLIKRLECLRRQLGVSRRIELLTSNRFSEPVAFGLVDWRIALPSSLKADSATDEIDALLAHEIAHLRRGDIVWLHVGRILTTCLAIQPLNFLARRQWQLHAEFQCDDWAVARSVDAVSLARSLTIVAELKSTHSLVGGALPAGGRRSHITERVERLLTGRVTDVWSGRLRRVVLGISGIALAGVLTTHGPSAGAGAQSVVLRPIDATSISDTAATLMSHSDEREIQTALSDEVTGLSGDIDALLTELELLQPLLTDLPADSAARLAAEGLERRIGRLREAMTATAAGQ